MGVTAAIGCNVTLQNFGTKDVTGLEIRVKMLGNNSEELQQGIDIPYYDKFNGTLRAGQTYTLEVGILTKFSTANEVWAPQKGLTTTIITVNLGDVTLDELQVIS